MMTIDTLVAAGFFSTEISERNSTFLSGTHTTYTASDTAGRPSATSVDHIFRAFTGSHFYRSPIENGITVSSILSESSYANTPPFFTQLDVSQNYTSTWNYTRTASTSSYVVYSNGAYVSSSVVTGETTQSIPTTDTYRSTTSTYTFTDTNAETQTNTRTTSAVFASGTATTTSSGSQTVTTSGGTATVTKTGTSYVTASASGLVKIPAYLQGDNRRLFIVTASTHSAGFPSAVASEQTKIDVFDRISSATSACLVGSAQTFTVSDIWYSNVATTLTTTTLATVSDTFYNLGGTFSASATGSSVASLLQTATIATSLAKSTTVSRTLSGFTVGTNGLTVQVTTTAEAPITTQQNLTLLGASTTFHATHTTTVTLIETYAPLCVITSAASSTAETIGNVLFASTASSTNTQTQLSTYTTQQTSSSYDSTIGTATVTNTVTYSTSTTESDVFPFSATLFTDSCYLGYVTIETGTATVPPAVTVKGTTTHSVGTEVEATSGFHTVSRESYSSHTYSGSTTSTNTATSQTTSQTLVTTGTLASTISLTINTTSSATFTTNTSTGTTFLRSEHWTTTGGITIKYNSNAPIAERFTTFSSDYQFPCVAFARPLFSGALSPLSVAASNQQYANLSVGSTTFCYPLIADATIRTVYASDGIAGTTTTASSGGFIAPKLYTAGTSYTTETGVTSSVQFYTADSRVRFTISNTSSSTEGDFLFTGSGEILNYIWHKSANVEPRVYFSSNGQTFTSSSDIETYANTRWSAIGGSPHDARYAMRAILFPGVHHFTLQADSSTTTVSTWLRSVSAFSTDNCFGIAFPVTTETFYTVGAVRRGSYHSCERGSAWTTNSTNPGGLLIPSFSDEESVGFYRTSSNTSLSTTTSENGLSFASVGSTSPHRPVFEITKFPDV